MPLLLFRVGGFYETFERCRKGFKNWACILPHRIQLVRQKQEHGGYHHSLILICQMVKADGNVVAHLRSMERTPRLTKTIVKRGVTEPMVTPAWPETIL